MITLRSCCFGCVCRYYVIGGVPFGLTRVHQHGNTYIISPSVLTSFANVTLIIFTIEARRCKETSFKTKLNRYRVGSQQPMALECLSDASAWMLCGTWDLEDEPMNEDA